MRKKQVGVYLPTSNRSKNALESATKLYLYRNTYSIKTIEDKLSILFSKFLFICRENFSVILVITKNAISSKSVKFKFLLFPSVPRDVFLLILFLIFLFLRIKNFPKVLVLSLFSKKMLLQ